MELVIIAAVAEDGTIGTDGGIPWDYPADMEHFKETTMDHPVIMGRGTWDSMESYRPLPGRTNIVISHEELEHDGIVNVHAIDEAVGAARQAGEDRAYVIGGESIYRQFLERDLADRMVLTEVPGRYDGDTVFPDWDAEDWREIEREEDGDLAFVTYARV